jgi:hypothetical protein
LSTAETFDVFVSYTHADASAVKPLVEALRGQDLRVWFDERAIATFDSITRSIVEVVEVLGDVAGARPGHPSEPSGIVHVTIRSCYLCFTESPHLSGQIQWVHRSLLQIFPQTPLLHSR